MFGPQGVDFLSIDLLKKTQAVVKERNTLMHIHVQQGDRETYQIVKRYGKRPVELMRDIELLDERIIAVHLTDCTEEEAAMVARTGASMIAQFPPAPWFHRYNRRNRMPVGGFPGSRRKLRSGIRPGAGKQLSQYLQ